MAARAARGGGSGMARRGGGGGAPGGGGGAPGGGGGGDVQYILQVFRACRLCGAGGGYKMPICGAPGAGGGGAEPDLPGKIRDLTHIEVSQNDKMPPLICELCVDKVNDFYEFVEMCRQTNARTRERLGLPPQAFPQGSMDAGDCILGVTEPVFVNDDSNDGEPLARQKNRIVLGQKGKRGRTSPPPAKVKRSSSPAPTTSGARSGAGDTKLGLKELRVNMNGSHRSKEAARASRSGKRAPSPPPPRKTRRDEKRHEQTRVKSERDGGRSLATISRSTRHKGILKMPKRDEDDTSLLRIKTKVLDKRGRERRGAEQRGTVLRGAEPRGAEPRAAAKKVKLSTGPPPPRRPEKRRAGTPPPRTDAKRRPGPASVCAPAAQPHRCSVCRAAFAKAPSLHQHMKSAHTVTFTLDRAACNPCGEWFASAEDAGVHHRWHKSAPAPYVCRLCTAEFRQLASYNKHFAAKMCVPSTELPDVQCPECWQYFPTEGLVRQHTCAGEDGRPGGKCAKCRKPYAKYKNLRKHEESCLKTSGKRRETLNISPELLRRVRPAHVRVARCDPLLDGAQHGDKHYDVSSVRHDYGLDKKCVYPYISSVRSIKMEPDHYNLSNVKDEIKEEPLDYEDTSFADYESYSSSDEEVTGPNMVPNPFAKKKSIDRLSIMSLRTIFSTRFLGPKTIQKKRKRRIIIKPESIKSERNDVFDSLFNAGDKDVTKDIVDLSGETVDKTAADTTAEVVDITSDINDTKTTAVNDTTIEGSDISVLDGETTENTVKDGLTLVNHQEAVEEGTNKKIQNEVAKEEDQNAKPTENPFDDEPMDQDVSSCVDDLIAGLNSEATDQTDEKKEQAVATKTDAIEKNSNQETITENGNETLGTSQSDIQNDLGENKIAESSPVKSTDKEKDDLEAAINDFYKEGNMNDDDFDVNSMFSGDLGSAALQSKPITTTNDNKSDEIGKNVESNEDESPKIDVRIGKSEKADGGAERKSSVETAKTDKNDIQNSVSDADAPGVVSSVSDGQSSVINVADAGDGIASVDTEDDKERGSDEKDLLENNDNLYDNNTIDDDALMAELDAQIGEDGMQKNYEDISKIDEVPESSMTDSDKQGMVSDHKNESDTRKESTNRTKHSAEVLPSDENVEKPEETPESAVNNSDTKKLDTVEDSTATPVEESEKTLELEDKISLDELLMSSKDATSKTGDEQLRESMNLDSISDDEFNFDA